MPPDGAAVLRKENGFLFGIRSVAASVSVKSLAVQGFSSMETKATKKLKKNKDS